jgi:hypothetical protein
LLNRVCEPTENSGSAVHRDDPRELVGVGVGVVLDLDVGLDGGAVDHEQDVLAGLIDGHRVRAGVTEGPAARLGAVGDGPTRGRRGAGGRGRVRRCAAHKCIRGSSSAHGSRNSRCLVLGRSAADRGRRRGCAARARLSGGTLFTRRSRWCGDAERRGTMADHDATTVADLVGEHGVVRGWLGRTCGGCWAAPRRDAADDDGGCRRRSGRCRRRWHGRYAGGAGAGEADDAAGGQRAARRADADRQPRGPVDAAQGWGRTGSTGRTRRRRRGRAGTAGMAGGSGRSGWGGLGPGTRVRERGGGGARRTRRRAHGRGEVGGEAAVMDEASDDERGVDEEARTPVATRRSRPGRPTTTRTSRAT